MTFVSTSPPRSRRDRLAEAAAIGVIVLIVGLFLFSILEGSVF